MNDPPARHSANHQSSVDHVPLNPSPPCPRTPPHTPHTATPPPLPAFTHKQHLHIDRTLACTASLAWRAHQPPTQQHRFSSHHPSNTHPHAHVATPLLCGSRAHPATIPAVTTILYAVTLTVVTLWHRHALTHQPPLNPVRLLGCTLTAVTVKHHTAVDALTHGCHCQRQAP